MTAAVESALCLVNARHEAPEHRLVCDPCVDAHATALRDVARLFPRLSAMPGSAGGATDAPSAPGFESRSPARDEVLALTDVRGSESVPGLVLSIHREARSAGAVPAHGLTDARVEDLARALATPPALGWWSRHEDAATVAEYVATARHRMLRVLGDLEPTVPIGPCPSCAGVVRARVYGETARCRGCGETWEGRDRLRVLAASLGRALLDAAGLARYLGENPSTIRTWAQRDGWSRYRQGRRTLFALDEARSSADRRRHAWRDPRVDL